jgi:GNAT superfamily N-acetyltransferase
MRPRSGASSSVSRPEIRRAGPDDAAAIARVHAESWRQAYSGIVPAELIAARNEDVRAGQWREMLGLPSAWTTLVAEVEGRLVAVSSFQGPAERDPPEEAELRIFYVHPRTWRTGVGRALMTATVDAIRAEGCDRAVLWVMCANAPARRFYEALGWQPDGHRDTWVGVPTLRYQLPLT